MCVVYFCDEFDLFVGIIGVGGKVLYGVGFY